MKQLKMMKIKKKKRCKMTIKQSIRLEVLGEKLKVNELADRINEETKQIEIVIAMKHEAID